MMVCSPIGTFSSEKKLSSAMASTISGMIIGAKINASMARPLRWRISTPMARSVPRTVDKPAEIVLNAACRMSALCHSTPYHLVENPVQAVGSPPSLKDKATSTEIGM